MKAYLLLTVFCWGMSTYGEFSSISLKQQAKLRERVEEAAREKDNQPEANVVLGAIDGTTRLENDFLLRTALDKRLNNSLQLMAAKIYIEQNDFDINILESLLSDKSDRSKYGVGLRLLAELAPSEQCFTIANNLINENVTHASKELIDVMKNMMIAPVCASYLVVDSPYKKKMYDVLMKTAWNKNFRQFLFEYLVIYTELENQLGFESRQIMERCIMSESDSVTLKRMFSGMSGSMFKETLIDKKTSQTEGSANFLRKEKEKTGQGSLLKKIKELEKGERGRSPKFSEGVNPINIKGVSPEWH
jgi:hypothetical protein